MTEVAHGDGSSSLQRASIHLQGGHPGPAHPSFNVASHLFGRRISSKLVDRGPDTGVVIKVNTLDLELDGRFCAVQRIALLIEIQVRGQHVPPDLSRSVHAHATCHHLSTNPESDPLAGRTVTPRVCRRGLP